jgi:dihydrodipicolinate synthase/N-acetylneuraminate lyase
MTLREKLFQGLVIPAHPLALNAERKLDERRQRALTRYYVAAGSGGVAVGVHTTQFAIRDAGLYKPVLQLAREEMGEGSVAAIAGVVGPVKQAVAEAAIARDLGYHAVLLSPGGLAQSSIDDLIERAEAVAKVLPVMGFYLQPSVGGRLLPYEFWVRFAQIENVVAIKMAPFNRYQTIDVVRGVADAGRAGEIALYTGNDDNIVADLLTEYRFGDVKLRIVGGLLGHWAVWTQTAVRMLHRLKGSLVPDFLTLNIQVTDSNAAFFDVANNFHGCIAGIHEVLRRQGLLEGRWCLDPHEDLSPGQMEEIDRVYAAYPHLNDDAFVREHVDTWMK